MAAFSRERSDLLDQTLERLDSVPHYQINWDRETLRSWLKNRAGKSTVPAQPSLPPPPPPPHAPVFDPPTDAQLIDHQMIIQLLQEISLKLDGQRVHSEAQEVAIQSLSEAVSSVQEQLSRPPPRIRQRAPLTELTTSVKRLEETLAGFRISLASPLPTPEISAPADLLAQDLERIRLTLREELDGFSRSLADHEWLHPPAPHFSPEHASEMMAIAVGRTGQPVRIVDHPVIKSLAHAVAPQFPLPNSAELRKAIIDVAKRWHKAFNCATQGDYISLMVDGASMASRRWLGVCIATDSGFWFWRMLELPGTTGEEIADAIKGVVRELLDKGFTTVAVVTDNAANEIKAVRELAQAVNLPLFRIPCLSHTTNLAVKDFLNDVFSGKRFWKDIRLLYNALPHTNEGDPFHGMKYPCATRWLSLGDFVGEIEQRIGQIRAYLSSQKKLKNALDIVNHYNWRELWQCFTVLNRFTVWTENEDSTMLEAWPTAVGILRDLEQLRQQGNRFAGSFHFTFYNRLLVTADIGQLLLGYLITAEGIQWYRSLPDRSSAVRMGSQEWVNSQISPLVCHIARLLGTDPDAFDSCWQKVLKSTRFDPAAPIDEFWNCLRTQTMTVNNNQYRLQLITEMVRIVAKLPVSEAEVERTFSALRQLFGDRSQRAKHDLIEARLTIRMNRLEVSPEIQTHAPSLQDPDGDLLVSPIAWSWASRTPSSDPKSYPLTRVPTRGEKLAIASSRHSPVRGAPSPA